MEAVNWGRTFRRETKTFSRNAKNATQELAAIISKRTRHLATVSAPYLYDAAGAKCYDVEVMLKHTGEDNYTVSYVPSDEWLSDPARVYPVVLGKR